MADYLKIPELARRLDVSEKTARRYVKAGTLPSTFIGGAYRVTEEDLEAFLHGAEVKPEAAYPKGSGRSSLEPQLFINGLEDERRSRFAEVLALAAERWGEAMTDANMNNDRRSALIHAALDLSDLINERVDEEDWETLTNQERREIVATMEHLGTVAERGLSRLEHSTQTQAEERRFQERRDQIRRWTREISA